MAVHASHAALPYPIKNARFSLLLPYVDADGDPTAPTTPDTEISKDNAAAADCAEEASATSGMDGMALLTLSGAETDCSCIGLNAKVASGPKATLATLYPRNLATLSSGTLSAGSAGGGTLGTVLPYDVTGCFIRTTGGTGGGGTGGASNQARRIATYNTSNGAFTVTPNWETTPSTDTTYDVLLPEGVTVGMVQALQPATPGRKLVVDAAGLGDANAVKVGPTGSGTAQTARDLGAQLDAAVSTRASQTSVDTIDDFLDTELAAVLAAVDTEVAAILADTQSLVSRLTSARAGYLDNLNVGGNVASSAEVTAIQNNTRVVRVVPDVIERPDSGTITYRVELFLYDDAGNMEAPDSAPTIALVNQAGTDRSSRLDSTTMALVETGRYRAVYTADAADALEQLVWAFSVVEGGATRKYGNQSVIVDTTAVDFTAADRTKLETLHDSRCTEARMSELDAGSAGKMAAEVDVLISRLTALRAGYLDNLSAGAVALASVCTEARLAELAAANIPADVDTLLSRVTAAVALASVCTDARLSELDAGTAGKAAAEIDLIKTITTAIKVITDALGATAAANLAKSCSNAGIPSGAAAAGTLTTAAMTTNLAESTNDHYNGCVVVWLTGALAGQRARVADYAGTGGLITFEDVVTEAPQAGDTFILL